MNLDYANSTWRMDFAGDVSNALATNIFSGYSFQSTAANQYVSKVRIRNRGMGELACMDNLSVVIQSVDERPLNIDDDDDDLPDRWEFIYFGNLDKDGTADTDSDGITDLYEYAAGTDPTNATSYMRIADLDLDTETSSDVVLEVFGGLNSITSSVYLADEGAIPDRTFSILASTDPTATKTLADSITDDYSGANTWTDEGAVDLYDSRYYSISVSYDGYGYTNTEEWAMYKQSRPESEKVFICVPVDYGSAAANNLNSELGTQLGRGLYAGTDANDSDYLEYLENGSWEKVYWVASGGSNVWWGDGDIVDASITPGRAMWIHKNDTAQNTRSNAVFLGKSWTESTVTNFTSATNNMIYFGWALPIPGRHQNLTSDPWVDPEATPADQLGFAAAGASAGQTDDQYYPESLGDQIWIWNTNASGNYTWTDVYYLMGNWGDANYDDKWWDSSEGNFADFTLEPGRAYLYYHVGNQWENSALDWTPQDE